MNNENLISNLTDCISANHASAMKLKRKIKNDEKIEDDVDLNMIIDRSYLHLSNITEFYFMKKIYDKINKLFGADGCQ